MINSSQSLSTNIAQNESADMTIAPPARHEPPPVRTTRIDSAILSSVHQAAIVFGTASESRTTLQDIARLLINFDHFRLLCVADLKNAFHEQRQALAANRLAKSEGKKTKPNRIVRNRKGSWETLFRYFARHTRLQRDVKISAHGHRGDYTCELVDKKEAKSKFEKGLRIFEELGISRASMEALYVSIQAQALAELQRSIDDPMADEPEESTADSTAGSPDQPHATASEPGPTPPAGAPQDNIQPDHVPSIVNDARQTRQTTGPAPAQTPTPGKQNSLQPFCEENLQVLEKLANSGSAVAVQARQLFEQAKRTAARRLPCGPAAATPGERHLQTARQTSQGRQNLDKPHVRTRPPNGPAKEMHSPGH